MRWSAFRSTGVHGSTFLRKIISPTQASVLRIRSPGQHDAPRTCSVDTELIERVLDAVHRCRRIAISSRPEQSHRCVLLHFGGDEANSVGTMLVIPDTGDVEIEASIRLQRCARERRQARHTNYWWNNEMSRGASLRAARHQDPARRLDPQRGARRTARRRCNGLVSRASPASP